MKGKEDVSLDYVYGENNFKFYVNRTKRKLEEEGLYDDLKKRNYYAELPNYDVGLTYDDFFKLKTSEEQIKGLTDFCNNEIEFCKKLGII